MEINAGVLTRSWINPHTHTVRQRPSLEEAPPPLPDPTSTFKKIHFMNEQNQLPASIVNSGKATPISPRSNVDI